MAVIETFFEVKITFSSSKPTASAISQNTVAHTRPENCQWRRTVLVEVKVSCTGLILLVTRFKQILVLFNDRSNTLALFLHGVHGKCL